MLIRFARNTLTATPRSRFSNAFISGDFFKGDPEGAHIPSITKSPMRGIGNTRDTQKSFARNGSRYDGRAALITALVDATLMSFTKDRNVSPRSLLKNQTTNSLVDVRYAPTSIPPRSSKIPVELGRFHSPYLHGTSYPSCSPCTLAENLIQERTQWLVEWLL